MPEPRSEQQEEFDQEEADALTQQPGDPHDRGDVPAMHLIAPDDEGTFRDSEPTAVADDAGGPGHGGPEERALHVEEG